MIREINRNNKTDWNEKIQIELSLAELQIIYDTIGAIPYKYLNYKHKDTKLNFDETEFRTQINSIYNSLDTIISEHNGITDSDIMINTDVEIEIKGI